MVEQALINKIGEVMNQMIGCYQNNDVKALKQLFEQYKEWELNGEKEPAKVEEITELAKRNLDFTAKVADAYLETKNLSTSMVIAVESPIKISGPVSGFYREVIGHKPYDPKIN